MRIRGIDEGGFADSRDVGARLTGGTPGRGECVPERVHIERSHPGPIPMLGGVPSDHEGT
jgi:hypothetical protein